MAKKQTKKAQEEAPEKPKKYTPEELNELSKEVFESNPEADELFATSDGKFFFEENYAASHAWTLPEEDRKITQITIVAPNEEGE